MAAETAAPQRATGYPPDARAAPAARRPPLLAAAAILAVVAGAGMFAFGRSAPRIASGSVRIVEEAAVTAMNLSAGYSNTSPILLAEPDEPRFVAMATRVDAPDFGCGLQLSGDAGRTWVTADPVPELPSGAEKCYAPEIAFDADGTLYYLFVGLTGAGNRPMGVFLVTSADRGLTFTPPLAVLGPQHYAVRMAIDPARGTNGRIHLVWIEATSEPALGGFGPPPNPIRSAYSDDGGKTLSEPVTVSDVARERVVAPALSIGPDGTVHVAYYDLARDAIDYQGLEGPVWEEPWSLVVTTSGDGGTTFSSGRIVDDAIVPAERVMLVFTLAPPSLAAGVDGLVCVAWTDARHGDADAMGRCSGDGGLRWGPLRRLNDDRVGNGAWQYLPRLAVSPQGRVDAVFFDRRDDRENLRNHAYLTYSSDQGHSFAPNRRVSGDASDVRIGAEYAHAAARGQYEIGSRLALLSESDRAVAAWPDARHSPVKSTNHDIFSATVMLPSAAEPRDLRPMGAVLAGIGALTLVWLRTASHRWASTQ